MATRKFYETPISAVVFSAEPLPAHVSLNTLAWELGNDAWACVPEMGTPLELSGPELASRLTARGFDLKKFQATTGFRLAADKHDVVSRQLPLFPEAAE